MARTDSVVSPGGRSLYSWVALQLSHVVASNEHSNVDSASSEEKTKAAVGPLASVRRRSDVGPVDDRRLGVGLVDDDELPHHRLGVDEQVRRHRDQLERVLAGGERRRVGPAGGGVARLQRRSTPAR